MTSTQGSNIYDKSLLLLFASLFSGNMSGVLLLPRTFSFLLLPLLFRSLNNSVFPKDPKILIGVWFSWSILSLLFTPDLSSGVLQLVLLLTNFLLACEILYFAKRSKQPLYNIALGWLIAIMINNIVGVWEITTDNHLSISKFGSERGLIIDGRMVMMHYANGFFNNYNSFVTFICCALPFLYYLLLNTKKKLIRCVSFANLIISIYIIFMDASRGGFLSMAMISAVFLFGLSNNRRSRYGNLLLFGLIIGFVVVKWDSLSALVFGRQSNISNIEDEARFIVWGRCFRALGESFGLGSGIGGLEISMENVSRNGAIWAPHNAFLEILVQYGIIVFFFFLYFLKSIYTCTKIRSKDPSNVVIYASFLAMPFIFIINSMYLTNPFFWAFLMSLFVFSTCKANFVKGNDSRFLCKNLQ